MIITPSVERNFFGLREILALKYITPSVDDAKRYSRAFKRRFNVGSPFPSYGNCLCHLSTTHGMDSTSCQSGVPIDPFDLESR